MESGELTVVDALREARALIARGWCHVVSAENADGHSRAPLDPTACRFDSYGALEKVCHAHGDLEFRCLRFLDGVAPGGSVLLWEEKDERGQADALAVFAKAIHRATVAPNTYGIDGMTP